MALLLLHGTDAHAHPEELSGHLDLWHWDAPVLLGLGVAALGYAFVAWRLWRASEPGAASRVVISAAGPGRPKR